MSVNKSIVEDSFTDSMIQEANTDRQERRSSKVPENVPKLQIEYMSNKNSIKNNLIEMEE